MKDLKNQIKLTIKSLLDVQKIALDLDNTDFFKSTVNTINALVDLFLLLD